MFWRPWSTLSICIQRIITQTNFFHLSSKEIKSLEQQRKVKWVKISWHATFCFNTAFSNKFKIWITSLDMLLLKYVMCFVLNMLIKLFLTVISEYLLGLHVQFIFIPGRILLHKRFPTQLFILERTGQKTSLQMAWLVHDCYSSIYKVSITLIRKRTECSRSKIN
jgi:hypothetical protein